MPKLSFRWTIRRKIALAFAVMSGITVTLGVMSMNGAKEAGTLVTRTYDETVVTTVYARAASSDFASMRAELATWLLSPLSQKVGKPKVVAALHTSFQQDLATAVERSGSAEVADIAGRLRSAEEDWFAFSQTLGPHADQNALAQLDDKAHLVDRGIEAMVSKVAEDGFSARQNSRSKVERDTQLALMGTIVAVLVCAIVSFLLARRIGGPLTRVAQFASEIAQGKLDGAAPPDGADEIGAVNQAMVAMRRDIRDMMAEQADIRAKAEARVLEALDGSSEGVVVIQANGAVQIANARALDFLGLALTDMATGITVDVLINKVKRPGDDRSALLMMIGDEPEVGETQLPDGRWIQNSRNRIAEGGMVALYTDVTGMRDQRDALAAANFNLDGAMMHMSQGLCVFDVDSKLALANPQFYNIIRLDPAEAVIGTPYAKLIAPEGRKNATLESLLKPDRNLARAKQAANRLIMVGEHAIAVTQAPMPTGGWLATFEDVTERSRAESRIAFLATHDAVTRLPNRTLFAERVEEALLAAHDGQPFAVHCLDLDHFKQVNDTLGHAVGDELLQEVTRRLLVCVREKDTVARLGGDEFAILQADVTDEDDCASLASRLIETVSAPYSIHGQELVIGLSIGIARAPANGLDHGKLLKSADAALYKSKDEGRGTWRFFEEEMNRKLQERRQLERDLRQAIANDEFQVFFQPLLDVRTMEIGACEALLRWNHPVRGQVSPVEFIPLAEETGFITEIGRWVMQAACQTAMKWSPHVRIAVNVSAVQLRDAGFRDMVEEVLSSTGLAPQRLEIEITESVFMVNNAKVTPVLMALKELGIHFAMDDFGTGYSSLSNLRSFPFSKIKIDRSFVRDLGRQNGAEQIIKTIVALGKTLGMRVAAEGVETRKQLKVLEDEGCDDIQGYLVGRPMPASDIAELLGSYRIEDRDAA